MNERIKMFYVVTTDDIFSGPYASYELAEAVQVNAAFKIDSWNLHQNCDECKRTVEDLYKMRASGRQLGARMGLGTRPHA